MQSGSASPNDDNSDATLDEQDNELIAEFVQESVQGLQEIEADLLALESHGSSDSELINRIFRTVHTIKGSGGYLKLNSLVSVAHRAETLLDNIRVGTQDPTPVVTDAVLGAIDTLQQMLGTDDFGATLDYSTTLRKLDSALGVPVASQAATATTNSASQADDATQSCKLTESDIASIRACRVGQGARILHRSRYRSHPASR